MRAQACSIQHWTHLRQGAADASLKRLANCLRAFDAEALTTGVDRGDLAVRAAAHSRKDSAPALSSESVAFEIDAILPDRRQGGADGDPLCNRLAAFNLQLVVAQIDLYEMNRP